MGGTVRLITKPAEAQSVTGYIDAQGFDINHGGAGYDLSGTVNLPIVPSELGAKFSAYTVYKPGYFSRQYGVATTPGYACRPAKGRAWIRTLRATPNTAAC